MNYFATMLYNMSGRGFMFTMLGFCITAYVAFDSWQRMDKSLFASPEWRTYENRLFRSVQYLVGLAVIAVLFKSIPSPDFNKQIVNRVVNHVVTNNVLVPGPIRVVYRNRMEDSSATYQRLYAQCTSSLNVSVGDYEAVSCADQARLAAGITVKVRTITKKSSYQDLFDDCNNFSVDGAPAATAIELRNERLKICNKVAFDGSR